MTTNQSTNICRFHPFPVCRWLLLLNRCCQLTRQLNKESWTVITHVPRYSGPELPLYIRIHKTGIMCNQLQWIVRLFSTHSSSSVKYVYKYKIKTRSYRTITSCSYKIFQVAKVVIWKIRRPVVPFNRQLVLFSSNKFPAETKEKGPKVLTVNAARVYKLIACVITIKWTTTTTTT